MAAKKKASATPAKKKTAAKKKTPAKKTPVKRRADYGAGIESFLAKQSGPMLTLIEKLRAMIEDAAPDAVPALKWGMPMYTIDGAMVCGLGVHKAHLNLILAGPQGTFDDPDRLLSGGGKTGRHLKLEPDSGIPKNEIRRWVKASARMARGR